MIENPYESPIQAELADRTLATRLQTIERRVTGLIIALVVLAGLWAWSVAVLFSMLGWVRESISG